MQRNDCCHDDQFVVGWSRTRGEDSDAAPGWHNIVNVFGAGRNTNQGKVEIGSR